MSLDDLVQITITAATATPTRPGFGKPLAACFHTVFPERTREYARPGDLISDGFTTSSAAYRMATAIKAQNPSVRRFKIGRRGLNFTEHLTLKMLDATIGTMYAFQLESVAAAYTISAGGTKVVSGTTSVVASAKTYTRSTGSWVTDGFKVGDTVTFAGFSNGGNNGAKTIASMSATVLTMSVSTGLVDEATVAGVTATSVQTVATAAFALAAQIDADSDVAAASAGDTITVDASAAGHVIELSDWNHNLIDVTNTTTDPGIATDMAAIFASDTDWYGFGLDSQSEAQIEAAALWAEANKRILGCDNGDAGIISSSTTDVASDLKAANYDYTYVMYNGQNTIQYSGLALMANRFTSTPGGDTWAFKTLNTCQADQLTPSQESNARGKNAIVYETIAGLDLTQDGKMSGGEYIDTIRFIDWLSSEIQIRVLQALASNPKIPYTEAGAAVVKGIILGTLHDGIKAGGLSNDPADLPAVEIPAIADIDPTTRGTRHLPDITATARLAGAIQSVGISITVSV